jgi:hypothetical protein
MQNNIKLQSLRIPSGWVVDINSFYEIEPSEDTINWLFGSPLLSCTNIHTGFSFEVNFKPEGEPEGEYIVQFYKYEVKNKKIDYKRGSLIDSKKTRNQSFVVDLVEEFMAK